MHRLSSSFVLAYHGCDESVGERILGGETVKQSANEYDWLGPGSYFWESNPGRALEFAREVQRRKASEFRKPFVVGAVIDLGLCLDLTTAGGMEWVRTAHDRLVKLTKKAGWKLPQNSADGLRRNLDCAVVKYLHEILREEGQPPIDTVKGIFVEGEPLYPGSGFSTKTHIQIAVCNPLCIKGVFRVPKDQLRSL